MVYMIWFGNVQYNSIMCCQVGCVPEYLRLEKTWDRTKRNGTTKISDGQHGDLHRHYHRCGEWWGSGLRTHFRKPFILGVPPIIALDIMWRFPKIGLPPKSSSHGWPWLGIETYGDLGIPYDLGNLQIGIHWVWPELLTDYTGPSSSCLDVQCQNYGPYLSTTTINNTLGS